jgi:hypothetical protein
LQQAETEPILLSPQVSEDRGKGRVFRQVAHEAPRWAPRPSRGQ